MRIALGVDHAGFPVKARVIEAVEGAGAAVLDLGTDSTEPVDYPDYALKVGRAVLAGEADRGILVCGSGAGVSVAACKLHGIRAATCHDTYSAHQCVEHDDVNVLCIGARIVGPELVAELVAAFTLATFSGEERHVRRLAKVARMEAEGR